VSSTNAWWEDWVYDTDEEYEKAKHELVEETVHARDLRQRDTQRLTLSRGIFRDVPARQLYLTANGRERGPQFVDGGREEVLLGRC